MWALGRAQVASMPAAKALRQTGCSAVPPKPSGAKTLLPSVVDVVSAGGLALASAVMAEKQIGDPKTNAILLSVAEPFVVRLVEWFSDKSNMVTLRQERDGDFFDELQRHLAILTESVDSARQETQRTAQNTITVPEAIVLIEQYRDQAARSVLEERRKLLAAAAAATFHPDVDVEMKSRAERAMAILEPSDIEALRTLKMIIADAQTGSEVRILFGDYPLTNRIALEQSGCIITYKDLEIAEQVNRWGKAPLTPQLREIPDITPLGETVLTLVETYKRDESGQAEKAGGAG